MKKSEILKGRREISKICGRGEYFFFASLVICAAALCMVLTLAVDSLMRIPEVSEAYGSLLPSPPSLTQNSDSVPFYLSSALEGLASFGIVTLKALPTATVFTLLFLLIVSPIYQGTVRYCAYLIEEGHPLPIRAILFYFLSPKFYFPCVFLGVRIFLRKLLLALCFLLMPSLCIGISLYLGSDYYAQNTLAAVTLILSAAWFLLAAVLFFIFCEKYSAVRYLFALGFTKKLFKASGEITEQKRAWLFSLRLRLMLNIFLAVGIVSAPYSLARIFFGHCLSIKALIFEKKQKTQKAAVL